MEVSLTYKKYILYIHLYVCISKSVLLVLGDQESIHSKIFPKGRIERCRHSGGGCGAEWCKHKTFITSIANPSTSIKIGSGPNRAQWAKCNALHVGILGLIPGTEWFSGGQRSD